jgi:soluble lytic murein transglycosylase-like protein
MQVRSQALAVVALWLLPQVTMAWADGPLCDLPQGSSFIDGTADDAIGMCAPRTVYLLRNPRLDACAPMSGRAAPEDATKIAAHSLERARYLDKEGLYEDALLNLRVVEATLPNVADHMAFMRGELHERYGDPFRASLAYRDAVESSPSIELRARARVAFVRTSLRAGAEGAESELSSLLARYPSLPEAATLRLELARHRELTGHLQSSIALYRAIDLAYPGYPMAAEARERLAALSALGHSVPAFADLEQLERTERLVRTGPIEQARATVMELRTRAFPKALVKRRDDLIAKFDELEARRFPAPHQKSLEVLARDPALEQLQKRLSLPGGEKQLAKLRPPQLLLLLRKAAARNLAEVADVLVREFSRRPLSTPPELRFEALTVAVGTADDTQLVALADTLLSAPTVTVPARYHRARALERLGRLDEAALELSRVVTLDLSPTRFYATWADQRLRALSEPDACRAPGRANDCNQASIEATLQELESSAASDVERALVGLTRVEAVHRAAYPWLTRALHLVRLGELDRAADELHETYLAYRFVARRGSLRAGCEAVYRGAAIARPPSDIPTHRARLLLDLEARTQLAEVATALGDWGTAVDFGGFAFSEQLSHPYGGAVAQAARKYHLDPDLLFAVMRVESVYQRRIISHAGAIGLMQIMPRTGRLIADKLGQRQMTATDLLNPRTNIEFSAWYLSSLINRMEGRLPLAIASYNGGPHNVRAWIRSYGEHVPLDAFLERIPFRETKRYVRRVLGYYTRYKAQRGERVELMAVHLPTSDKPGEVAF